MQKGEGEQPPILIEDTTEASKLRTDLASVERLLKLGLTLKGSYPRQHVETYDEVTCENLKARGRLLLTNYRILFIDEKNAAVLEFPINLLASAERKLDQKTMVSAVSLLSKFKTQSYSFKYSPQDFANSSLLCDSIVNFLKKLNRQTFACFAYATKAGAPENLGWPSSVLEKEMARQGSILEGKARPGFKVIDGSDLCPTYPSAVLVPESADGEVRDSAKLRHGGRFPVMVYCAADSQSRSGFISLYRCGQKTLSLIEAPRTDRLIELIIAADCCSETRKLQYIELREVGKLYSKYAEHPKIKAYQYELVAPRTLYDQFTKLCQAVESQDVGKYYEQLGASRWYSEVVKLLCIADEVADVMRKSSVSVVLECNEGTERSAQVSALVQLLIDPYFRTRAGFEVLVEKEFILLGHNFQLRNGLLKDNDNQAPLFLQFLDCVFQLTRQFPLSFEFNSRYLTELGYLSYSNLSGSFLVRKEDERTKHRLQDTTYHFARALDETGLDFANHYYCGNKLFDEVLNPCCKVQLVTVWHELCGRFAHPLAPGSEQPRLERLGGIYRETKRQCDQLAAKLVGRQ